MFGGVIRYRMGIDFTKKQLKPGNTVRLKGWEAECNANRQPSDS